jgi:hypothetical protein
MQNNSKLPIEYRISLDSLNPSIVKANEAKRSLHYNDLSYKPSVGPNNFAGSSPFDVTPIEGVIASGAKKDLTIIFTPDHQSELFADMMRISLSSTDQGSRNIQLYGKCRNHSMYIRGAEFLTNNLNSETLMITDLESNNDSQLAPPTGKDSEDNSLKIPIPILVTLYSMSTSKNSSDYSTAERIINIGCLKTNTNQFSAKKEVKKNGEFLFENLKDINAKGFNIDLTKSAVEPGGERPVKITWKPPTTGVDVRLFFQNNYFISINLFISFKLSQTVQSSILITTKGDVVETWKLILKGRIVSNDDANSVKRLVISDSKVTQSLSSSSFMKSEMLK